MKVEKKQIKDVNKFGSMRKNHYLCRRKILKRRRKWKRLRFHKTHCISISLITP